MKGIIFLAGFLTLGISLVWGRRRGSEGDVRFGDPMMMNPDIMVEQVLREMPIKEMDFYSERFYPEMIKAINRKFYSRWARQKTPYTEKRIRNIKLNAFLNIPNDRKDTGTSKSSFTYLSRNSSSSFVVYTVEGNKGGKQLIDIHSPDTACIFGMSEERTAVKAKACREDVPNMTWDLIPNKFGDFWVRQQGTKLCLAPVLHLGQNKPVLLQLLPCSRYDPYLIWEIQDAYLYYKK